MPLVFESVLRRADTMDPRRVDGIIRNARDAAIGEFEKSVGGNYLTRALHPGDIPPTGTTERRWLETTATTTDVFVTAAIGDGTNIADDTVIAIFGVQFKFSEQRNGNADKFAWEPPVSSIRFVIGGTRVAEWDLYTAWDPIASRGATSSTTSDTAVWAPYPYCVAESPVIIKPRTSLLVQFYELTGTASDFSLQILGIVVEQTGSGDGLNP